MAVEPSAVQVIAEQVIAWAALARIGWLIQAKHERNT